MALKKLKAWKIINGVTPVTPDGPRWQSWGAQRRLQGMASWNTRRRRGDHTQKVTSNRKKFKKHLTDEYELWEELNGIALSKIYDSCTQSIQLLIGKKKDAIDVWKQLESSFAVSGFASVNKTSSR
jgi:hypothetical protein